MFDTIIKDLGLSVESQNEAGSLFLLLAFARDNGVTATFTGNPFTSVKALLSAGRSNGYRQIENLLSSGEQRWASRH